MASKSSRWILAALIIAAGLVLWLSPEERTLGQGIKIVYVHVAVTWTSMVGFVIMGLLGIGVLVYEREDIRLWMNTTGLVSSFGWVLSIILSMWASEVNWGGVPLGEPRYIATFNLLAVIIIVQVILLWIPPIRLRGLIGTVPAVFLIFSVLGSRLILHPTNAIRATASLGIRFSFYSMFVLVMFIATWVVINLRLGKRKHLEMGK
jgi:hypothetical protein